MLCWAVCLFQSVTENLYFYFGFRIQKEDIFHEISLPTPLFSFLKSHTLVLSFQARNMTMRVCLQSFPASGSFPVSRFRWPKCWSFNFSISPFNEYSVLISFRMDWLDLLAVQGTLKSLLRHHSSKASTLQHSAFFMVQLSHPYMTTGKTIVLTIQTFVSKVMSLFFNMLFRFVLAFLPRSKHLLILWL